MEIDLKKWTPYKQRKGEVMKNNDPDIQYIKTSYLTNTSAPLYGKVIRYVRDREKNIYSFAITVEFWSLLLSKEQWESSLFWMFKRQCLKSPSNQILKFTS